MRYRILPATICVALIGTFSHAQTSSECHSFLDNDLRLECYDDETGYEEPKLETISSDGGWVLIESKDDFSNANTSLAVLESDASGGIMSDAPEAMIARCDGNGGHDIYVKSGGYIGARDDRVPVRYKFGDSNPVRERWSESTTGTAAFLPSGYKDFRLGLLSGEDFVFEITDYNGTSSRARFENASINLSALEFVVGGCK